MAASTELNDWRRLGVPSEVAIDSTETAHLMMPMTQGSERFGISICGYPAEYLTIIPDLEWASVLPERRCQHCSELPTDVDTGG